MGAALRGVTGGRSKSGGVLPRPYGEQESAVRIGGGVRAPRPTESEGAVQAGRRGNRLSAAGGGRSEPVSRKCPDWRPRQWTGIGWHDGGQSPTLTESWARGRTGRCGHRPLRKYEGSAVRGEYGLPHQPAGWFAMTFFESAAGCENGRSFPRPFGLHSFIYIPERRGCGGRGGGGLRRPPAR